LEEKKSEIENSNGIIGKSGFFRAIMLSSRRELACKNTDPQQVTGILFLLEVCLKLKLFGIFFGIPEYIFFDFLLNNK
jgi:hypothetical protein